MVVIGDGARWVRGVAEMYFAGAVQIIDLYHAREHIGKLCQLLFGEDARRIQAYRMRWWTLLDEGKVEKILAQARALIGTSNPNQSRAPMPF